MQMGLQALLLGRTSAVQLVAADSFFNPVLSGLSAPTYAPVLLVAWIACSSADFEAACLPAQPLHACRLRTCFLSSQMCFQSLPKAVGRQCGSLQGAGFCFRPGCHGKGVPATPPDGQHSWVCVHNLLQACTLRLKLLSPQLLTCWRVQVQDAARCTYSWLLPAPQLPSMVDSTICPYVCAQYSSRAHADVWRTMQKTAL